MALRIGHLGTSTRELADRRSLARVGFGIIALPVACALFTVLPHAQAVGLGALVALGIFVKIGMTALESRIDTKIAEELRPSRGSVAEEHVGEVLDEIGDEHLIVHDIHCPHGRIDHLIFSKSYGVFLVESMAHSGRVEVIHSRIRINGKLPETDFVVQALRNTSWLVDELERIAGVRTRVSSLVVFTNAFVVTSRSIKGVTVTNKKFLLSNIQRLGKPLAPEIWTAREKIAGVLGEAQLATAA
ncbi:MAG TPA: nuclease-related domain-containing protein [Chthoniobacter sp.]|jgi:hypothetical protein